MDRPDGTEKALRKEVLRLGNELELTRVALESAHAKAVALAGERDRLRRATMTIARRTGEPANDAGEQPADATERLRTALEEASVLAEELQAANEELHV